MKGWFWERYIPEGQITFEGHWRLQSLNTSMILSTTKHAFDDKHNTWIHIELATSSHIFIFNLGLRFERLVYSEGPNHVRRALKKASTLNTGVILSTAKLCFRWYIGTTHMNSYRTGNTCPPVATQVTLHIISPPPTQSQPNPPPPPSLCQPLPYWQPQILCGHRPGGDTSLVHTPRQKKHQHHLPHPPSTTIASTSSYRNRCASIQHTNNLDTYMWAGMLVGVDIRAGVD